jgi:hypothetical protein
MKSWTCYDKDGEPIELEVVDYDFKDEVFLFEDT